MFFLDPILSGSESAKSNQEKNPWENLVPAFHENQFRGHPVELQPI